MTYSIYISLKKDRTSERPLTWCTLVLNSSALHFRQLSAFNSHCSTHVRHPTRDSQHMANMGSDSRACKVLNKEMIDAEIYSYFQHERKLTELTDCTSTHCLHILHIPLQTRQVKSSFIRPRHAFDITAVALVLARLRQLVIVEVMSWRPSAACFSWSILAMTSCRLEPSSDLRLKM